MSATLTTENGVVGLIADDDARMRKVIRSVVQDLAREICEAGDGREAVEAFRRHKPSWVTLDLAMRPVDGWTALREIRANDPLARVIIVTAHDTTAFREAARLAGACAYILKDDLSKIRDAITAASAHP
jgi:CheY-like chemotaxis protein